MSLVREITVGNVSIGGHNKPLVLIAGPCVIENEELTLAIARHLVRICRQIEMPLIFKASYDKANRTSGKSFRGPGLDSGLAILAKVKKDLKVPVITDVHSVNDVARVAAVADVVQIPAFLCRQTDLLQAGRRGAKCINIKKGQFLGPLDNEYGIEKIVSTGNQDIMVTERGTSFGYNRLVADMCGIPIMREYGYPVVLDATHSVQIPGGGGASSGGIGNCIPFLARAGAACGCDGIFIEVHPNPDRALSDGSNSLNLDVLSELLPQLQQIDRVVKN